MATMVKEKRREKKKSKEKSTSKAKATEEIFSSLKDCAGSSESTNIYDHERRTTLPDDKCAENPTTVQHDVTVENIESIGNQDRPKMQHSQSSTVDSSKGIKNINIPTSLKINSSTIPEYNDKSLSKLSNSVIQKGTMACAEDATGNYEFLNMRLARIEVNITEPMSVHREKELLHPNAYLKEKTNLEHIQELPPVDILLPSAPMCDDELQLPVSKNQDIITELKPYLKCMSLEEAMNTFGGAEMSAVKVMSAKEEAIVEAGPLSGPEHPLVDLLSTFKSSLRSVENERLKLASDIANEEKFRFSLWKIEKRQIYQKIECKCKTNVELKAVYEHAELLKDRMPVARLRLEGLLRDIQDSYCHYQHAALLTHYQIENLISETTQSSKKEIREALSLILQALRMSDGTATVHSKALRRWAAALVAALVDDRDLSHLLFVLHYLFRQSRSVRWASRVLQTRVTDGVSAARALALLDTLLASPRLDTALECTEENEDEGWEEVSVRGAGGAVSEGALREIDLTAILRVFPVRDIVARILMFTHADIREARPYEWGDVSGGRALIAACCGVRALLETCQRGACTHPHYTRLHAILRNIAASALEGLSCLYRSPRAPYENDLQEKIEAEMQACFTAAFTLFGSNDLHKLNTSLLTEHMAMDYCMPFIIGLHDKSPKPIERLGIEIPVLTCDVRVRIVTHAAARREQDHELAKIVLEFLFQTGGKSRSPCCVGGCVGAARGCLAVLIAAHPYLHTVALHTVANLAQVESLDPTVINLLEVHKWRPQCGEIRAVLEDWEQRCPQLLQQLLLLLDYTPHIGLSLPVQLYLGGWVCAVAGAGVRAEGWWRVLLRLRTHRVWWGAGGDAVAPVADPHTEPRDELSKAYAVLSTSWGHCIPLICSSGVEALCALCSRPRELVHCLAPVLLVMADSPESLSLTPKFREVFRLVLNCEPTLVQRALGRDALSGSELLLRLALSQIEREQSGSGGRGRILSVWLHALWRVPMSASASCVVEAAALAAREWPTLDVHAARILQEENAKEYVASALQNASSAPLLCECLLRAYHTHRELNTRTFGAVANILWEQRVNGQRIHVHNALQKISSKMSAEDLVIYQSARAALVAPMHHPSHLALWRLFLHLYLQRPPNNIQETALPVGPLFYSGLIKSRMLSHIKKRLQDVATYHQSEAETYKISGSDSTQQSTNRIVKSESITIEKGLLPALTIKDLTGESSSSDSDSDNVSEESEEDSKVEERQICDDTSEVEKKNIFNMACYHTGAERMVRDYCQWLEEGDRVRASPHHADIARFIPEQALEAAWNSTLSRCRPPPSPDLDEFPCPTGPPASTLNQQITPLDIAVKSIMNIKARTGLRTRKLIKYPLEDIDFKNTRTLLAVVDVHLKVINELAKEWCTEVSRVSSLDTRLWELVATLRVPRPLPPVTRQCTNTALKCKPIVFHISEREWCISTGAERGIKENRRTWVSATCRLSRPRQRAARTAAGLHCIARRIEDAGTAMCVLERAWCAGADVTKCGAAGDALAALFDQIAQRWICHDGRLVADLLSRWCSKTTNSVQQALCGSLISPRRIVVHEWPLVYMALMQAKLPTHTVFSYLSKFEMHHWSQWAEPKHRRELLEALLTAQSRHGQTPPTEHSILLELLGLHTAALVNEHELFATVMKFAKLSVEGTLPPQQWTHLVKAADIVAGAVSFDQLGHLLRDLGALWWEARSAYNGATTLVPYAAHVANLLSTLLRNFQASAVKLSYEPERVGRCVWSAAQESWGAWVAPHPTVAPLLPTAASEETHYSTMLQCFVDCLQNVMAECPGCEIPILQQVFEWSTAIHVSVKGAGAARQESRAQVSELLGRVAALPWDRHQWFYGTCLHMVTQMCGMENRELMLWWCDRWRSTDAITLLRDVTEDTLEPRLAALLYLLTGTHLTHSQHILDEATRLPWWRLPESALAEALDRFFAVHHNPLQAYHDLPQFQVVVFSSELCIVEGGNASRVHSRGKRARALTQWVGAGGARAPLAHVPDHVRLVLRTLHALAPYLKQSEGEMEELLGRASIIMCMEPAAAAALPVWQHWISTTSSSLLPAVVSATSAITAIQYCAVLADTAIREHLLRNEGDWVEAVRRWQVASPWRSPEELARRASLHAAYVCALVHTHAPRARTLLAALLAAQIHFIDNEVIIAVWICYACRIAVLCSRGGSRGAGGSESDSEWEESGRSARALLSAWAVAPRRSILRVVTLQPHTDRPTALHRVLCRFAECIVSPSPESALAYQAACSAVSPPHQAACSAVSFPHDDATAGVRSPPYQHLPTLAATLYPRYQRYFQFELDAAHATR